MEQFYEVANILGVSEQGIKSVKQKMTELSININSIDAQNLLQEQANKEKFESYIKQLVQLLSSYQNHSKEIQASSMASVEAILRSVELMFNENIEKLKQGAIGVLDTQEKNIVDRVSNNIGSRTDKIIDRKIKLQEKRSYASWAGIGAGLALICGTVGYLWGSHTSTGDANAVASSIQGSEGWKTLVANNNADQALATYCQQGSQHVTSGGTYCNVPMWLSHSGTVSVVPGSKVGIANITSDFSGWLHAQSPYVLLLAGLVIFLAIRFIVSICVNFEPLRKFLAIPTSNE